MSVLEKISLERAKTAESVGVSSKEVQKFIDQCMEENKELHSIMVIRHGKVACEAYRDPFGPEHKHMMYSVSKSFTSTAIGFAIDEGYIDLDTKFVDIFPEARKEKPDEYLEKMTVEDLLTMRSGLSVTPMMDKRRDRWFKSTIESAWVSEPGTEFLYISENMYLLCCIIHKVVGMSVMKFLQPRLFEPLGIEEPFWETCPRGIEAGGWGMMIKTEDLAKFTLCYLNGGKFQGKQVIPEWWTREAVIGRADSSVSSHDADCVKGYGYCFWRNSVDDSFRADGMFSQFGIGFEKLDACVIATGGEVYEQGMRDVIWNHFPKAFIDEDENAETVELSIPPYKRLPKKPRSFMEKKLVDKTIKFARPPILDIAGFPISVLPLTAVFMEKDKAGNITDVSFAPNGEELVFSWREGDERNSIRIGMDGEYRWDKMVLGQTEYNTCAIGCWHSETELEIHIRAIEAVAERHLVFKFSDDNVTMKPSSWPESSVMAETLKETVKDVIKQPLIRNTLSTALPHVISIIDLIHVGRITNNPPKEV